jgi:[ribosomal protein S18]-alanine N-acetyltransferase
MESPPAPLPPPPAVRMATAEDLPRLAELDRAVLDPAWTVASWAAELARPDAWIIVATWPAGGTVRGLLSLRCAADRAELLRVGVEPAFRRRGLGRLLVAAALQHLRESGIPRCWLEVAEANLAARRLYHACGFGESGRRAAYYAGGAAAVLMDREGL